MAASVGSFSTSNAFVQFVDSSTGGRTRRNADKKQRCRVSSVFNDPYKTLSITPGASESEVKKAFRKLALQYHPDACRGSNCCVQFSKINEAYDVVMRNLRGEPNSNELYTCDPDTDEQMRGMNDPNWELWEEWMGWEGAGIRDYSSHINPYI